MSVTQASSSKLFCGMVNYWYLLQTVLPGFSMAGQMMQPPLVSFLLTQVSRTRLERMVSSSVDDEPQLPDGGEPNVRICRLR